LKRFIHRLRLCALCFLIAGKFLAQDTLALSQVDVMSRKVTLSSLGKRTDQPDSNVKQQFVFASVADMLSMNSTVFFKNYGPGAIATTALRGGNASQTAVLWNGFNIQNNMLGQVDMSLLPSVLFENVQVEYGGSSSLWGSGAVGGSIQLFNQAKFNKGFSSRVNVGGGSFSTFNASAVAEFSMKRFFSSTKAYIRNSNNNYTYYDTLDKEHPKKELNHAAYGMKGIMQEIKYLISNKQSISASVWYNAANRQIPSFSNPKSDKVYQIDGDLRSTVSWNYFKGKYSSNVKGAFFSDRIIYNDSLLSLYSNTKSNNLIFENEHFLDWNKSNRLNLGANVTHMDARSENYTGTKQLTKISLIAGNKFSFANEKLILYPAVRAEYFSVGKLPVTGNLAMEYHFRHVTAKLSGARVYRQPTFNELYWFPGGNPNLKPEQGYTAEGDLSYERKFEKIIFSVAGSAFNRMIDNWILWLPGAGNSPTPVNIQQVWSRGTETRWKLAYRSGDFGIAVQVFSSYVLSTVNRSDGESNTEGRQLIYTPRYSGNGIFTVSKAGFSLSYYQQYVGYRFTASDNSEWLAPYHYSSVRFNLRSDLIQETNLILYMACNNIFNSRYAIVERRYMPLRNFEFGLTLSAKKPKKEETINP
jgi:iron complex outermembrane receptor protein